MSFKLLSAAILLSTCLPAHAGTFEVHSDLNRQAASQSSDIPSYARKPSSISGGAATQDATEDADLIVVSSGSGRSFKANSIYGHISHKGGRPQKVEKSGATSHFWSNSNRTIRELVATIVPKNFDVMVNDYSIMDMAGVLPSDAEDWDVSLNKAIYGKGGNRGLGMVVDWNKSKVVLSIDLKQKAAEQAAEAAEQKRIDDELAAQAQAQAQAKLTPSPSVADSSAPAVASVPAATLVAPSYDVAMDDGFLSKTLSRWCKNSDGECQQVKWLASNEIVVEADAPNIGDTFSSSVDRVFDSLQDSIPNKHLHHRLSPNGVLIVTE